MKKTLFVLALAVVALMIFATSAFAATTASDVVTITASVNQKVELTLSTNLIDFGSVDPGDTPADQSCRLDVKTNHDYTIARAYNPATFTTYGLLVQTAGFATGGDQVKTGSAGASFTDVFRFRPTYDTPTGAFTIPVQYTVTAKP